MSVSADMGLLLLRIGLGLFFASSGYHKLMVPEVRAKVIGLFKACGVENRFVDYAVPIGEFMGGIGLLFGVLTNIAALGLIVIMAGAIYLDCWRDVVKAHPRDAFDWIAKCIYLPEGLLTLNLTALAFLGGGAWSVDSIAQRVMEI